MQELKVRLTFTEDILGTTSADPDIHKKYIASKAPDVKKTDEEVAAIDVDKEFENAVTIFPKEDGIPFMWDYQIKGFFKDACGVLRKVEGTKSNKMKAYKKEIDGLIFIKERKIPFDFDGEITICERPLRASTPQGDRVALASSESIPAGATAEFTIMCLIDSDMGAVREWLRYGTLRGIGQWRNSDKGRLTWEAI